MIAYAQGIGLKVILKPMVNVADGTWRAHINFLITMFPASRLGANGLIPIVNT